MFEESFISFIAVLFFCSVETSRTRNQNFVILFFFDPPSLSPSLSILGRPIFAPFSLSLSPSRFRVSSSLLLKTLVCQRKLAEWRRFVHMRNWVTDSEAEFSKTFFEIVVEQAGEENIFHYSLPRRVLKSGDIIRIACISAPLFRPDNFFTNQNFFSAPFEMTSPTFTNAEEITANELAN